MNSRDDGVLPPEDGATVSGAETPDASHELVAEGLPSSDVVGGEAAPAEANPEAAAALVAESTETSPAETPAPGRRPSYVFLGAVAAISLTLDIASKCWAEVTMNRRGFDPIELIDGHLAITLAYNPGGAWGLFAGVVEYLRKPFFLVVSATAIWFIVSLYGRLNARQKALTWGLPLVLGGALGNLSDRITRSHVIDFIDYRAEWVLHTNAFISRHLGRFIGNWTITDHWPTFNVADVAICIGVGLMAVDMFSSRKHGRGAPAGASPQAGEIEANAPASPAEELPEAPAGPTLSAAAD